MTDKNNLQVSDIGGIIYLLFLYLMLTFQLGSFLEHIYFERFLFSFFNFITFIYFLFRIFIFNKLRNRAKESGNTLIDYLKQKYEI
jgi:hypothetical protein